MYRACEQRVYYASFDILRSQAAALDAVQEIFLKIWVNREKLAGMDYFPAWLNTLTRNHLYDVLRAEAHREKVLEILTSEEGEPVTEAVYSEVEFRELTTLVTAAIDQLSPQQQKVFALSRKNGMKHREISAELGISTETVKKHIMEAMRHVRAYLRAHGKAVPLVVLIRLIFS